MKLIVDIPNLAYYSLDIIEEKTETKTSGMHLILDCIRNGIPLPEGHGRLIDADETLKAMDTWDKFGFEHTGCFVREPKDDYVKYVHYEDMVKAVSGAPTIVEADKEKENEDSN